ncbi:MAG TPA: SulP family inorganic anion transporter, partial [Ottowia sp.]|nr:SulP family inorganic anion transporter [Ottowia sp.]
MHPALRRYLPFLRWPRPTAGLLRNEALAGLTVGLMMIPQSVAYAQLAGMPPVTGIYASILPALVAVLFSSSQRLSVGPTALTALRESLFLQHCNTICCAINSKKDTCLCINAGMCLLFCGSSVPRVDYRCSA